MMPLMSSCLSVAMLGSRTTITSASPCSIERTCRPEADDDHVRLPLLDRADVQAGEAVALRLGVAGAHDGDGRELRLGRFGELAAEEELAPRDGAVGELHLRDEDV